MRWWTHCRHEWKVLHAHTLPSAFEQMMQVGVDLEHIKGHLDCFRTAHLVLLVCVQCGRLRKVVERNPD